MKNTFSSLFKHGLILFFAVAQNSFAQYPIFFNDNTSQTFNNLNLNTGSYQVTPTPEHIEYTGISNITANASVVHQASRSIHFGGRFHAGGFTQGVGNFKAGLKSIDVDVAAYSGVKTGVNEIEIGEYEKLEFGLVINRADILAEIDLFLYGNGIVEPGLQGINPFDPDRISFEVTPTIGSYTVSTLGGDIDIPVQILPAHYGFYYIDYETDVANNTWNAKYTPHPWRFRYACKKQGNYEFRFVLKVPGYGDFAYNKVIKVKVVPSDNKGFLEVGSDKKHFRYSKTKTSFFGVGCNLFAPSDMCNGTPDAFGNCQDGEHYNNYWDYDEIGQFKQRIEFMSNYGANYFRMALGPEGFDAEQTYDPAFQSFFALPWYNPNQIKNLSKYRGLGNYQNNGRYHYEMDNILDLCKDKNMKIHLVLTGQNLFHYGSTLTALSGSNGAVRWPSSPYYSGTPGGIVNVDEPIDFFTNAIAKAYFKKKLRYYIARWGYSTEIANLTFTSETDGIGNIEADPVTGVKAFPDPFWVDSSYPTTILNWSTEMANFVRNDLHCNHLIGNNFRGEISSHVSTQQLFFNSPTFDFNSSNVYQGGKNTHIGVARDNVNTRIRPFNKPYLSAESGIGWDFVTKATSVNFHTNMWFSACSESPVTALHWDWRDGILPFPDMNDSHYCDHFVGISTFMNTIDFENTNYAFNQRLKDTLEFNFNNEDKKIGLSSFSNNYKFEFFAMTNQKSSGHSDTAYGWIHNRSYYYGSLLWGQTYNNGNNTFYCPEDDDGIFNSAIKNSSDAPDDSLLDSCSAGGKTYNADEDYIVLTNIEALSRYRVDWYSTSSGNFISSNYEYTILDEWNIRKLKIHIPFISDASNYDFAFKVFPDPIFGKTPNDSLYAEQIDSLNYLIADSELAQNVLNNAPLDNESNDTKIIKNSKDLIVFPNPIRTHFFIKSETIIKKIILYDNLGMVIYDSNEINKNIFQLNVETISSGIYNLKIELIDNMKVNKRVIKL